MGQTEKKPVTREDLFQFRFVSEVSFSPDGQWASYVVNQADREENRYHSGIWAVNMETKENKLLAARGEVKAPVWLDEETLLFASGRDMDKEEAKKRTEYYRLSLTGGEAVKAMSIPVKVEKLRKLKDKWLVLATVDENQEDSKASKGAAGQQARGQDAGAAGGGECQGGTSAGEDSYEAEEGKDYYIYEELPFWFNGKGIRSRKRSALYLFDEVSEEMTRVSQKYLDIVSFDVSPDKTKVVWCGPEYDSVMPRTCGLYLYNIEEGKQKQLVKEDLYDVNQVCFMGDGKIFYTASTYERVGKHPRYYIYDLAQGGSARQLPYQDASVGNIVGSDAKFGGGSSAVYCREKDVLYLVQTLWGDSKIMAMDQEGAVTEVTKAAGAVTGFDVNGGRIVMTAMRGQHLAEVYALCPDSGEEEKLTGFNDEYLENHKVSHPESFRYDSKNGYEMEGYVTKPADYEPGKKYPAVLEIHGGPKTASGTVFFHEYQCLANDGYFVIYCNPRGSDGRGEAFADITEVFGKDDFEDLLEFTDQALAHYPDIDPGKVGVCGGSYGGFMCNWIVGHTDRYAAAVSQRSISNYLTKCLYTDIGYYANRLQMGAYPWENFHKVWSMSPLSGAKDAKTPLLLLQSDEDYRCWMGDAIQMFSAVKRQGTDARLVLFHGENHELSRSGKPENRMTRLKELEGWFEKYLR